MYIRFRKLGKFSDDFRHRARGSFRLGGDDVPNGRLVRVQRQSAREAHARNDAVGYWITWYRTRQDPICKLFNYLLILNCKYFPLKDFKWLFSSQTLFLIFLFSRLRRKVLTSDLWGNVLAKVNLEKEVDLLHSKFSLYIILFLI